MLTGLGVQGLGFTGLGDRGLEVRYGLGLGV